MLITHTRNAAGHRRIYLGGKGSLEAWLEPTSTGGWTFCSATEAASWPRSAEDIQAWADALLNNLAAEMGVRQNTLHSISFDEIAECHTPDPTALGRQATGRRRANAMGFVATPPSDIVRTAADAACRPVHRAI